MRRIRRTGVGVWCHRLGVVGLVGLTVVGRAQADGGGLEDGPAASDTAPVLAPPAPRSPDLPPPVPPPVPSLPSQPVPAPDSVALPPLSARPRLRPMEKPGRRGSTARKTNGSAACSCCSASATSRRRWCLGHGRRARGHGPSRPPYNSRFVPCPMAPGSAFAVSFETRTAQLMGGSPRISRLWQDGGWSPCWLDVRCPARGVCCPWPSGSSPVVTGPPWTRSPPW